MSCSPHHFTKKQSGIEFSHIFDQLYHSDLLFVAVFYQTNLINLKNWFIVKVYGEYLSYSSYILRRSQKFEKFTPIRFEVTKCGRFFSKFLAFLQYLNFINQDVCKNNRGVSSVYTLYHFFGPESGLRYNWSVKRIFWASLSFLPSSVYFQESLSTVLIVIVL